MQSVSFGSFERAWRALAEKRSENVIWQQVAGPLSVVCLSLLGVDWYVGSSLAVRPDLGEASPLLLIDSRHLVDHLRAGIQRWQTRGIQSHAPGFFAGCELWPRGIRACVGSRRAAVQRPRLAGVFRFFFVGRLPVAER